MPDIKRVGVCGSGLMGSGIAQVTATAGYDVVVFEVDQAALDRGMAGMRKSLDKFVEKKALSEADRDTTLQRLKTTTNLADLKESDLVIEAIVENMPAKKDLFKKLDALLAPHAIICSNTCLLYTSPSPRDLSTSRMPSSA